MEREELISRMNELSDRLVAGASALLNKGGQDEVLAGRTMMLIASIIDDTFDDFNTDDCEGEA